jgi:hypothetical protein
MVAAAAIFRGNRGLEGFSLDDAHSYSLFLLQANSDKPQDGMRVAITEIETWRRTHSEGQRATRPVDQIDAAWRTNRVEGETAGVPLGQCHGFA